jgi:hypothetical protein
MTDPTISEFLKYANLQLAAESFLIDAQGNVTTGAGYVGALADGNFRTKGARLDFFLTGLALN